jgi:hypothetical protein
MLRKRRCGSSRKCSRTWRLTQLSVAAAWARAIQAGPRYHETLETEWRTLYRFISHPSLVRPLNPMAPRRKCNVCGSQQWHKEPATGLVVCSEGHILQVCGSLSAPQHDPLGLVTPWNCNYRRIISTRHMKRMNTVRFRDASVR